MRRSVSATKVPKVPLLIGEPSREPMGEAASLVVGKLGAEIVE
ncbi:MAG: hypothetical protein WEB06_10530 [Actinomycetota bacterium]